mmetsp:Transcript_41322/g.89536  ORF Transcript_41322/g.89536 Transcript_41322/m.89536 type:complete len:279 (+) Transcript_41322:1271-2107(+)
MIFSAVEDIDTDLAFHHIGSLGGEINCWETFANLVLRDLRGVLKDLLSDLLWCWSAVFAVELDAKVFVQATWIVRGRQDEGSERHKATLTGANHGACRWSAQQSVVSHPNCLHSIGNRHLGDELSGILVEIAAISSDDNGATLHRHTGCLQGIKSGLNEVLQVVLAHEDLSFFSEAGSAWLLPFDGRGALVGDCQGTGQGFLRRFPFEHHGNVRRVLHGPSHGSPLGTDRCDGRKSLLFQGASDEACYADGISKRRQRHGIHRRLSCFVILGGNAFQE